MSTTHNVLIDFSTAGMGLDRDEMEEFVLNVADELQTSDLVTEARLARESDIPDAAKPGAAAFLMGILTAEINLKNIRNVVNFLGNQFYGKTLTISGEMDGLTYTIEYRDKEDVDLAVDTIARLSNLRINILNKQTTSE